MHESVRSLISKAAPLLKLVKGDMSRDEMQHLTGKRGELESLREEAVEVRGQMEALKATEDATPEDFNAADYQVAMLGSAISRIDNQFFTALVNSCPATSLRVKYRELIEKRDGLNRQLHDLDQAYLQKSEALYRARRAADTFVPPNELEPLKTRVAGIERELAANDESRTAAKLARDKVIEAIEDIRAEMVAA